TVIFDMDGVIIDSEPLYFEIEKEMFEDLNIAVPFDEHCTYVGTSSSNMWETIIEKHHVSVHAEELVKKEYDLYMDCLVNGNNLRPIAGVAEFIQELRANNYNLVIASSS